MVPWWWSQLACDLRGMRPEKFGPASTQGDWPGLSAVSWTSNTQNQLATSGAAWTRDPPSYRRIPATHSTPPTTTSLEWNSRSQLRGQNGLMHCVEWYASVYETRWAKMGWFPDCLALLSGEFLSDVMFFHFLVQGWGWGRSGAELEPSYVHLLVQEAFSPYHLLFMRNLDAHPSLKVHECSGLLKLDGN